MPQRCPICFDVTHDVALGRPAHIAGTLFVPEIHGSQPKVAVLVPGGGFTRRYFDLELEGHPNYSAAMQLAGRGWTVVAIDNLGTGESTIPDNGLDVTLDRSASALASVACQLRVMARSGALHPSLPAREPIVVGIGHSLGGCIVTLMQGDHSVCDAIVVLGYSCRYIKGAVDPETGERLRRRESVGNGYNRTTPSHHRERFYSEKVPLAIIEAEEAGRVPMPDGVAEALIPGRTASAAARIRVPVLLAFGERDVAPEPHAEPGYYHGSNDITLLMLADSGHAHNSAPGRVAFWNRIGGWMDAVTGEQEKCLPLQGDFRS